MIKLYDSVKKQKIVFESQEELKASVYVCGPTVYDDAHLGHARSAIVFDLLHRVLKANDYDVKFVKNFTDIDDKIINKAKQTGKTIKEITSYYIKSYKKDMDSLNILPNSIEPYATQNIEAMIDMCQKLLIDKKAYVLDDGLYLNTSKDTTYGSLSNRASDENSQARVESNNNKKDQKDFALWKFFSNDEVGYDTPFGYGRPGWHLECSAMIDKHLTNPNMPYAIDIHGGGADLLFPHHENEACQTRCCTSQELAKYWLHNGFVNINGQKMSKSLGNSFFLKDALAQYDGEIIRFYMLTTSYRADFSFSTDDLNASKKRLDKLYRVKKRVYGVVTNDKIKSLKFAQDIKDALNDDLNTPKALACIDEFVNFCNDSLDKNPKDKNLKKQIAKTVEFIGDILGIGIKDSYDYFQFGITTDMKNKINKLIIQRTQAKKDKNFELSDKIRDELKSMNVSLMDTPSGTVWEIENQ
jgi:cysteinyl-tRNA synthetase